MDLNNIKRKLANDPPLFIGEESAFRSAVVIPLVEIDNEWHVLFQVRAETMRDQPGDISFPGGQIDETDSSAEAAAIRETYEELGVCIENISVISELSPFIFSPSFVVYPFVVKIDDPNVLTAYNRDEVEEVFTIRLDWLLQYEPYTHSITAEILPSDDFPFHKIKNGKNYQWRNRRSEEWFFDYENYTIWGITARILKYFLERIK